MHMTEFLTELFWILYLLKSEILDGRSVALQHERENVKLENIFLEFLKF